MRGTKKSASKFAAELPEFPCPIWNAKAKALEFLGTPLERREDSAKQWLSKIRDMLENGAPGLTNRRREDLSRRYKQLAAFLGQTTKTARPFRRL